MSTWIVGKGTIPAKVTNYDRLRAKSAEETAEKIGVARGELASVEAAQAEV